jgi:hypothetical protein
MKMAHTQEIDEITKIHTFLTTSHESLKYIPDQNRPELINAHNNNHISAKTMHALAPSLPPPPLPSPPLTLAQKEKGNTEPPRIFHFPACTLHYHYWTIASFARVRLRVGMGMKLAS